MSAESQRTCPSCRNEFHEAKGGSVTVKIIDLGLAKAVNEPGSQTAISTAGGFAGTPEFASPEQFAGVGVDIRSDLYASAIVLLLIPFLPAALMTSKDMQVT